MPIERISANQFAEMLRTGITDRDATFDTTLEVNDLAIQPQARVFETQHDDTRQVSLMLTLADATVFEGGFELDLEGIVFNEGITRILGAQAEAVAVFSRSAAPTNDLKVQRGYAIATVPDEGTGLTVTFVAIEERTMLASAASSYFNVSTRRYELSVPVVATVEGAAGVVGAGRINRPLRPLAGFDSVGNVKAASGGRDRESNQRLIDRNLIAIIGREIATGPGIEKVTVDDFADVSDVLIVSGTNPLLTRASETAGAVDAYLIGTDTIEQVESPTFLGRGQLIPVAFAPIVDVVSVQDLSTGTTFVEGTDYEVVHDATGVARSARALDGIRFNFTGAAPAVGKPVTITYDFNNLIRRLQSVLTDDTSLVFGRDLLFKEGIEVPIILTAKLRVASGYSASAVLAAVRAVCLKHVNPPPDGDLGLDGDAENSDIQGVVRQISGVDNFIITRLTRSTVPSGTADVAIAPNEYPTLASADLTITFF